MSLPRYLAPLLALVLGLFLPTRSVLAQTNPVNVASLGSVSGTIGGVALAENYLYLANSSGLQIFDVSNPSKLADVGYRDAGRYASWVQVQSNLAYVVYYDTVRIFDISNRTNPIVVGHIDGYWRTVTVSGRLAYLAPSGSPFEVSIYDVSTTSLPTLVSQFGGEPTQIAVSGNYAYLVQQTMNIADVSDPSNPKQLDAFYCQGIDVVQSGNYAYVACQTNGFEILDVSDPAHIVSVYHSVGDTYNAVALSGNYAYLAGFYKFAVFDISNPTNANLVVSIGPQGGFAFGQLGMTVARGYAYLGYSTGMSVFALGEPVPPSLSVTVSQTGVTCSWPVPNPAFAVQQSSDLNLDHWTTLINTPLVVGSQNQVTFPKPQGAMFYRLVSQ